MLFERALAYVRAPSPSLVSEKQKGSHARKESLKYCRRVGSGMEEGGGVSLCGTPFLSAPPQGLIGVAAGGLQVYVRKAAGHH